MAAAMSEVHTVVVQLGTVMAPTIHILLLLSGALHIALAITFLDTAVAPPAMVPAATIAVIPLEVGVLAPAPPDVHCKLDESFTGTEPIDDDGTKMYKSSADAVHGFQIYRDSMIFEFVILGSSRDL